MRPLTLLEVSRLMLVSPFAPAGRGRDPSVKSCPLCGRPLIPGPSVNEHHLMPRAHGGRVAEGVHRVCHDKIHAVLSERELARDYRTWEALRGHPEIARFVEWVRRKHPEFIDWNRAPRRR